MLGLLNSAAPSSRGVCLCAPAPCSGRAGSGGKSRAHSGRISKQTKYINFMSWTSGSAEKRSEPMDRDTEIWSCCWTPLYPFHLIWRLEQEQKQDQELTWWICQGGEAAYISPRVLLSLNLLKVDFQSNFCFFVVWFSTTTTVFDICTKHLSKNSSFPKSIISMHSKGLTQ